MHENVLIIGCGDTGKRVLRLLAQEKELISVTSHQTDSQRLLKKLGINVIAADLDKPQDLNNLPTKNAHIFYFAPPPTSGTLDSRMQNFINSLSNELTPKRIVYISTTGVYGTSDGLWITESTELAPANDRSKRRHHAESLIQAYCAISQCEYVILRVAGIYCLEKLSIERIKAGMKVLHPDLAPSSNRIHADDLANCCVQAMFKGPADEIFNIADGHPSSISDYFIQIAKIFDLPEPELLSWERAEKEISPAMLSYLHESKKISNEKLLKVLNISLKYPSLTDGLLDC